MYMPLLRGKQNELLALREFATMFPGENKIIPIIEPVKANFNSLKLAIDVLLDNKIKFALILNPQDGDFKKVSNNILDSLPRLMTEHDGWIAAFNWPIGNIDNDADLPSEKMIILRSALNEVDLEEITSNPNIEYIVTSDKSLSRKLKQRLNKAEKKIVKLSDNFPQKKRNLDYIGIEEELFTEEHLYYKDDGYFGFSDYTLLPQDFSEGGSLPAIIAIHLSYDKGEDGIFMSHFLSDEADGKANIQKKFAQAAYRIKNFFESNPQYLITDGIREIIENFDNEHFPGLGPIKKFSIKNHLEIMLNVL